MFERAKVFVRKIDSEFQRFKDSQRCEYRTGPEGIYDLCEVTGQECDFHTYGAFFGSPTGKGGCCDVWGAMKRLERWNSENQDVR